MPFEGNTETLKLVEYHFELNKLLVENHFKLNKLLLLTWRARMKERREQEGRNISKALSNGRNSCCSQSTATMLDKDASLSSISIDIMVSPEIGFPRSS